MSQSKLMRPNGPEVRRQRMERGWSVGELAGKMRPLGPSSIYHIEAGRPSKSLTIYRLAKIFGVPVEEISLPDEGAEDASEDEVAA